MRLLAVEKKRTLVCNRRSGRVDAAWSAFQLKTCSAVRAVTVQKFRRSAMRNARLLALLVSLTVATPVKVQEPFVDRALPRSGDAELEGRAALRMELQPTTQRETRVGSGLFWTGVIVAVSGSAVAALSDSVFATRTRIAAGCDGSFCFSARELTSRNETALVGGVALAGVGVTLAMIGLRRQQRQAIAFVPMRGGGAVFRRIEF